MHLQKLFLLHKPIKLRVAIMSIFHPNGLARYQPKEDKPRGYVESIFYERQKGTLDEKGLPYGTKKRLVNYFPITEREKDRVW